MNGIEIVWQNTTERTRAYVCMYCGNRVAPLKAYTGVDGSKRFWESIHICNCCLKPTYFDFQGKQIPAPRFGEIVLNLPKDIQALYNEARDCMSVIEFRTSNVRETPIYDA